MHTNCSGKNVRYYILFFPVASAVPKEGPSRTLGRLPKVLGEDNSNSLSDTPSEAEKLLKQLQGSK